MLPGTRTLAKRLPPFAVFLAAALAYSSAMAEDEVWHFDESECDDRDVDGCAPAGYHLVSHPRRGLLIAGSTSAGAIYAYGTFAAATRDFDNQGGWMVLPLVGPWFTLGLRKSRDETERLVFGTGLVVVGLGQAVGAAMIATALLEPVRELVPDEPVGLNLSVSPRGFMATCELWQGM